MRYAPIVVALAVATTARADGGRTLHLAVHGSIDGAALAASLAKELDVEIALAAGTCELPCLDIAVDGKRVAAVLFAPRTGAPRQRSVKLGVDTRQWRLVITLLAGNVVRDESQDVLAGLPPRALPAPPVVAAPAEVPPAPDDPVDEDVAAPAVAAPAVPGPAVAPDTGDAADEAAASDDAVENAPAPEQPAPVVVPEAPAAPPTAMPAPEPVREHSFLCFGLVPGLSTDFTHVGTVRHYLSLDLLIGVSGGSTGLSISGIGDIERGSVAGFQLAGVTAIASRVASGFQIAGVAAVALQVDGTQIAGVAAAAGKVDGVQVAGVAALAARVDGVQAAGIAAVSRSSADTQIAGVAAVARGSVGTQAAGVAAAARGDAALQMAGVASVASGTAGVQLAGVAAVAGGDASFQAGGVTSVAHGTANIQLAGVVNVARRVRGVQIGTINVAHQVDGVQIGVINVGSAEGFSFGLINIVPGGRYDLEAAVDSNRIGTALFRHGGRRWHNVYGIGGHPVDKDAQSNNGSSTSSRANDDVWMYGFGFGPTLEIDHNVIDLEAVGWQVNHGPRHESDVSILGQLRLSVAHHWGPFAVVVGGALNAYVTSDQQSPLILERRTSGPAEMTKGVTVTTWPSAFVGVRI